ncbi:LysR family transcriptional regulator [Variovorax sp. CYS-02]|uniref:LysR family transcriptional regulator n=2 Tax=Variovorax terrae TaxID=2923278 RepID=A0A9X2APB1_9BURK|nr:LysR family transcriptional regulator [Variovorax terrae]MCJ0765214.1 LysR family transcriptional regulator [Variovorax terrae]
MHIGRLDLNLLRVFDAVYRTRSVSRASEDLGLSQPAASQAIARLRLVLKDALFVRVQGGVEPTPKAQRLATAVRLAISTLENALLEAEEFDARYARRTFRLHLTDTGEALFLPRLVTELAQIAPGMGIHSSAVPHDEIAADLDNGRIDFAIGFLPMVAGTQSVELMRDRYTVLLRQGHPFATRVLAKEEAATKLSEIDFVAVVRPHSETMFGMLLPGMEQRVKLTASHFLALPDIVQGTDLGVVVPRRIAHRFFFPFGTYETVDPEFPDIVVSLHWSKRFQHDPAHEWMRALLMRLYAEAPAPSVSGV